MKEHFIALDVHCEFCEMAAITHSGRELCRDRCATTIPALVAAIDAVRRPRVLTFEEGPLADWLARNLRPHVDRLIVCEPRRNALIAKEGDKDDPIDVGKLAQLLRGGYLKEVHQPQSLDRSLLKQHVSFYHDRVRERVRQGHQLVAQFRRHGVFASINDIIDADEGRRLWRQLPQRKTLLGNLHHLLQVHRLLCEQEEQIRAELIRLARREEPVRRFVALPGIAWIRALTFYVYADVLRVHRRARAILQQRKTLALLRHRPGTTAQRRGALPSAAFEERESTPQRYTPRRGQVGDRVRRQSLRRQVSFLESRGRFTFLHGATQRGPYDCEHTAKPVD